MFNPDLKWIANNVDGELVGENTTITGQISTDTRTINAGDLFVAIVGPNFDGNKFVNQAASAGAAAAIVSDNYAMTDIMIPVIRVKDTTRTFGLLGMAVRDRSKAQVVAITGSMGKTTTKQMVASILSRKGKTMATKGNLNNHIGVPMTLLRLREDYDFAVVEMGANHVGEIDELAALTKPEAAVVTTVAPAHLEGFGSIENIADAKGEIYKHIRAGGTAVVNVDCEFKSHWRETLTGLSCLTFSASTTDADVYATDVALDSEARASFTVHTSDETYSVQLPLPGKHHVYNALAAIALTLPLGVSGKEVAAGLSNMENEKGRAAIETLTPQLKVIDDTYNANSASIMAATDMLAELPGRHLLILGDMGELGDAAKTLHQQVGEHAARRNISAIFGEGNFTRFTIEAANEMLQSFDNKNEQQGYDYRHFTQRSEMLDAIMHYISSSDEQVTVLVKGSRSAQMEGVISQLKAQISSNGDLSC